MISQLLVLQRTIWIINHHHKTQTLTMMRVVRPITIPTTTPTQRTMAFYTTTTTSGSNKTKKTKMMVKHHPETHHSSPAAASRSVLDRATHLCPGQIPHLYHWHLSSSKQQPNRPIPTTLSMCIHTDRIEFQKVMGGDNDAVVELRARRLARPWRSPSSDQDSCRGTTTTTCHHHYQKNRMTTTTTTIPLVYHMNTNTRTKSIQNAADVMEQIRSHLSSTTTTSPNEGNHQNTTDTNTNTNNTGILLIQWPQSQNGRRGYDCGRVLHTMEQLLFQLRGDDGSGSHSSILPQICWYDPTHHNNNNDEDEWGRSAAHAYNNDDVGVPPKWIDPPYRLRDHSVLLLLLNQQHCHSPPDHHHHPRGFYNPTSLWTSFCTHYWPELLSTTTTDQLHDDDEVLPLPTATKAPRVSTAATIPPRPTIIASLDDDDDDPVPSPPPLLPPHHHHRGATTTPSPRTPRWKNFEMFESASHA